MGGAQRAATLTFQATIFPCIHRTCATTFVLREVHLGKSQLLNLASAPPRTVPVKRAEFSRVLDDRRSISTGNRGANRRWGEKIGYFLPWYLSSSILFDFCGRSGQSCFCSANGQKIHYSFKYAVLLLRPTLVSRDIFGKWLFLSNQEKTSKLSKDLKVCLVYVTTFFRPNLRIWSWLTIPFFTAFSNF